MNFSAEGVLPAELNRRAVAVEPPRDPSHGDLASNAAMVLAKGAGTNPRALAAAIAPKLESLPEVTSVEIAGPGFLNIRLSPDAWREELRDDPSRGRGLRPVEDRQQRAGQRRICLGQPDGPDAHGPLPRSGRRRLRSPGCSRPRAFGSPRNITSTTPARRSTCSPARCTCGTARRSAKRSARSPKACIPGDYLVPVGTALAAEFGDRYASEPEDVWLDLFRKRAVSAMLDLIRHDLGLLGIHHDHFASEAELQGSGAVEKAMDVLRREGPRLRRRARAAEEPRSARRVGAGRADPVPFERVRRRPGPPDEEVGRQLDLFRRRRRLSLAEGAGRRSSRQHLGRRPCRHGQARAGGGEGADRRPRRPGREARPDGPPVPRRRAGEDVQALGLVRHACRRRAARSARTWCAS